MNIQPKTQPRAIALISGGLDSMLAAKLIMDQGVYVEGVNFYTGFCVEGHTHAIRNKDKKKAKRNNALWSAKMLGIKLNIVDVSQEYKEIVLNPKHGYGTHLNPCLDCKIFMVKQANLWVSKAEELAREKQFDFIITGEVVGQRPKSQRKQTLPLIARESGAQDRLLRPLCAQHLSPTLPERMGWVDRNKLLDLHGRDRKPQIQLAKQFGFDDYAQPAGGCCFLTNAEYSRKLADLWQSRGKKDYEFDDIMLLKIGRHIRPKPHFKLIIGREAGENNFLAGYRKQFDHIRLLSHRGPLALICGELKDNEDILLAAGLMGRFGQGKKDRQVTVEIIRGQSSSSSSQVITAPPLSEQAIAPEWYL